MTVRKGNKVASVLSLLLNPSPVTSNRLEGDSLFLSRLSARSSDLRHTLSLLFGPFFSKSVETDQNQAQLAKPFPVNVIYGRENQRREAQVQISSWDTIQTLKAAIAKQTHIPISDQIIVDDGIETVDDDLIEDRSIDDTRWAELKCKPITVTLNGLRPFVVTLYAFETL
jgi:hypothetical protein